MSSSRLVESEIQQIEQQIAPISSHLDAKIKAFADALPPAVAAWMNSEVKALIENNAKEVTDAGIESIRELKSELARLLDILPEVCREAVSNENEWPHRQAVGTASSTYGRPREPYFTDVFRTAISELGPLLKKHGLLKDRPGYAHPAWEELPGGKFRYSINPGFEDRDFPAVLEYTHLLREHKALVEELERKRVELSKARVLELWDEA